MGQVGGGGGGGEVGGEEEAVWRVEGDGAAYYDEVRFGAGGRAEGGYECAVEIVCEVERGQDERGFKAEGGAGEGWEREGGGREWMEVGCEEEGEGRDELHYYPGLDAIDGEDAVGRRKPAKRRIVCEGSWPKEGKAVKEPLFGHCPLAAGYSHQDVSFSIRSKYRTYLYIDNQSQPALPGRSTVSLPSRLQPTRK